MKSKVSKFFEVKIQYQKMLENGKEKKVTEQYQLPTPKWMSLQKLS